MIWLISDLHLDTKRPAITQAFFEYLEQISSAPGSLYILGDLFELWVGDDDDSPLAVEVQYHLKLAAQRGLKVYVMPGNRDFLIGEVFAQKAHVTLLPDPHLLTINGTRVLLAHGDAYCTADAEYQAFRQQARSPQWQGEVLSKTLEERRILGNHIRQQSKTMNSRKASDIMDVTESAVIDDLVAHHSDLLIHGHTHRPNTHQHTAPDGTSLERIVLGDWDSHAWSVEIDDSGAVPQASLLSWEIKG